MGVNDLYRAEFEATDYWVDPDGVPIVLRIGMGWGVQWSQKWSVNRIAIVTAWNPLPVIHTDEENQLLQRGLELQIQCGGWDYLPAIGIAHNEEWREPSFCILDISVADALALGREFGQLAIVYASVEDGVQLMYC